MRLIVDTHEPFQADLGIALCCGEALVPEQLLNAAQVRPGIQKMGGEGMPQRVRRDAHVKARLAAEAGDAACRLAAVEASAPRAHEERRAIHGGKVGPFLQPRAKRMQGRVRKGGHAFAGALAHDARHALRKLDVVQIQPQRLGDPQAGAIEEFRKGKIAAAQACRIGTFGGGRR